MNTPALTHPFEAANLGKAPFKFCGMHEKVYVAYPGAPAQPAGTCCYCGMGIKYCCSIQSADGKKFIVGCDCVLKLNRADNRLVTEVERAKATIDRENARKAKAARLPKELARIEAARSMIEAKREALAAKPHPMIKDKTLADYVDYLSLNGGHSGRLRMARIVEGA